MIDCLNSLDIIIDFEEGKTNLRFEKFVEN